MNFILGFLTGYIGGLLIIYGIIYFYEKTKTSNY